MSHMRKPLLRSVVAATLLAAALPAAAQIPVSGRPVSQFSWLDDQVLDLMYDNDISGAMVAIMRNGVIIYQRGFGWNDAAQNVPMPENSLCRIASCTKPITAAAIQKLADDGLLDLDAHAFNLGQSGGGILNITPWPSLGDTRLRDVRVRHLLDHSGGWDRSVSGDLTYEECTIAGQMGVNSPPGRTNTMRWILGKPLNFSPGADQRYSNIGYLALGLIVEQVSGQSLITYIRNNILTQDMWIPSSDIQQGRTFETNQPAREAWYDGGGPEHCVFNNGECTFGCSTIITNAAYGSWDHEARIGQGGMLVSPATMLRLAELYFVQSFSSDIGVSLADFGPQNGAHGGSLAGCNTRIWQRSDGVNVFIFFNKRGSSDDPDEPGNFASLLRDRIANNLNAMSNWPTLDVEGFWASNASMTIPTPYGGYNNSFRGIADALLTVGNGSKLNLKAGTYNWTGTINRKLLIKAPIGTARIGG